MDSQRIARQLALKGWATPISNARFMLATKGKSTMVAIFDKNGKLAFSALNGKKQTNITALIAGIL